MLDRISHTFRALRNPNYRLFFFGQSVSQIGTWMQRTAVSWVVYDMTHSTFMLGLTVFASQFPSFMFSLYGGIVSDRYDRYKLILLTQILSMLQAIFLAVSVLAHFSAVWQILTLSALLGVINAFDVPARQPLVHEMIHNKEDLTNALALNSSIVNLARLIGPALSGLVLATWGAGICFVLNAISFVAVIISLLLMKLPPRQVSTERKEPMAELATGFSYLKQTPELANVLLYLAIMSFLVLPFDTLLPDFAKVTFHGDAQTFGHIYSCIGVGALIGTIFLASVNPKRDLKMVLLANNIVLAIGLIGFSLVSYLPVALLFAVLAGFGAMTQGTICVTIIQVVSAPHMRGRIISYLAMALFGMLPLGSLVVGAISHRVGSASTLIGEGVIALVITALFYNILRSERLPASSKDKLEETEETVLKQI